MTMPNTSSDVAHGSAAGDGKMKENPEFRTWLKDSTERYKLLSDEERNETLDTLIEYSGPPQLWHLQYQLEKILYRDFLRCLQKELQDYLLLFLDSKTLLACCRVCHAWNSIINSNAQIWHRACTRIDIEVPKKWSSYNASTWKTLFLKMTRVQNDLRTKQAYKSGFLKGHIMRVTAVNYCGAGLLATGSDDQTVRLWNCTQDTCLAVVAVNCSISSIKFDENILLTASYSGCLKSFNWKSNTKLKTYLQHTAAVLTVDFCTDLDLVVSGGADETLRLWKLGSGSLRQSLRGHTHWVVATLIMKADSEAGQSLILTMDRSHILVWLLMEEDASEYNATCNQRIHIAISDFNFFTPGLHSDGRVIYFVKQDPRQFGSTQLCCWDIQKQNYVYKKELHMRVKMLMAVGKKYACIITPWIDTNDSNFIVFNLENLRTIAKWHVPPSRPTTPGNSQMSFADSSWLDGLNGSNHKGMLFAAGLEDHSCYFLKWKTII